MNRRKPSETRAQTIRDKYGDSYFSDLGRKGGDATKQRAIENPTPFQENGKKGGDATLRRWGTEHMRRAPRGLKSKRDDE